MAPQKKNIQSTFARCLIYFKTWNFREPQKCRQGVYDIIHLTYYHHAKTVKAISKFCKPLHWSCWHTIHENKEAVTITIGNSSTKSKVLTLKQEGENLRVWGVLPQGTTYGSWLSKLATLIKRSHSSCSQIDPPDNHSGAPSLGRLRR